MKARSDVLLVLFLLCVSGCSYSYEVRIAVTVIDATTNEPIEDVRVQIMDIDRNRSVIAKFTVGETGKWYSRLRIRDSRAMFPSEWEVRLTKTGYKDQTFELETLTEEDLHEGNLRLYFIAAMLP